MAIAQPTNDMGQQIKQTFRQARNTGPGAGQPDRPVESPPAGGGNGPGPVALPTEVPPGWHPIELDLPVPGSQTPYHFNAATPQGIQPAVQGYVGAVRGAIPGLIGQPAQTGQAHPMFQHFLDYVRNLIENPAHSQPAPTGQHPLNPGAPHEPNFGAPRQHFPDVESLFAHLAQKPFRQG